MLLSLPSYPTLEASYDDVILTRRVAAQCRFILCFEIHLERCLLLSCPINAVSAVAQ